MIRDVTNICGAGLRDCRIDSRSAGNTGPMTDCFSGDTDIQPFNFRKLRIGRLESLCNMVWTVAVIPVAFWLTSVNSGAETLPAGDRYRDSILPILEDRCYDCHGDGSMKGSLALDEFKTDADLIGNYDLWWSVAKNIRARIMPPKRKPQLNDEERQLIDRWIQSDVFGIDPDNPDPGRVTVRRLNRIEYRNTIRDLMGIDFDTELEFPPDDTGYGFDNIGDVLSVSPLLLEKYVQAAEKIIDEAVPKASKIPPVLRIPGGELSSADGETTGDKISFYDHAIISQQLNIEHEGEYEVTFSAHVNGEFAFDPGECRAIFSINGREVAQDKFIYAFSDDPDRGATFDYTVNERLDAGKHEISVEVQPLVDKEKRLNRLDFRVKEVAFVGPMDSDHWVEPENYRQYFVDGAAPMNPDERRQYARKVLQGFGLRAFRRPVDNDVLDRLVLLAEFGYSQPGATFEEGISQALVAILSSPRFLFRTESTEPAFDQQKHPYVDGWALASRLSYFFWSSMPDIELFNLAAKGKLREQLDQQITRMLQDEKSSALVENFTGQWLQARNIKHVQIEAAAAFGLNKEWDALREKYGRDLWRNVEDPSLELEAARKRSREIVQITNRFNSRLREAMRRETEMSFDYVLRGNRNVLEFLDSDYTFLNGPLAEHYGIPGVEGDEMRRVQLPEDDPRGGVLTQGNMLLITSNPTRTSPVKRGLFILENILGTPTPPAPPNIPELDEAAEAFEGHEPTLRELLARHREDPLCSSCHNRIDPLGLAFENFTAVGSWRDTEDDQPIDVSGKLITGEEFKGVQELKAILVDNYRMNFYRCLTEKMLTYALGRGLEYYDEHTVDQIVERLDQNDGRFMSLIQGIVESAPFQKRRNPDILNASTGSTRALHIAQKEN